MNRLVKLQKLNKGDKVATVSMEQWLKLTVITRHFP